MCYLEKNYCNRCRTETGEQPKRICCGPEMCRGNYDLRWIASLNDCVRCRDLATSQATWRPAEEGGFAGEHNMASPAGITSQGGFAIQGERGRPNVPTSTDSNLYTRSRDRSASPAIPTNSSRTRTPPQQRQLESRSRERPPTQSQQQRTGTSNTSDRPARQWSGDTYGAFENRAEPAGIAGASTEPRSTFVSGPVTSWPSEGGQRATGHTPAQGMALLPPPLPLPSIQQMLDGTALPAPVFPPMQPLPCREDTRCQYGAPARQHPLAQRLATLGMLEPEEWELWRTNPPEGGRPGSGRGGNIGAEARLQIARVQRPGWQLPFPYEGFDEFRYRQERDCNRTDVSTMTQQFVWRNANDHTLRPNKTQLEKRRKAKGVVPGGLGGANFQGGYGGYGDDGGPGGAATGLGMAI